MLLAMKRALAIAKIVGAAALSLCFAPAARAAENLAMNPEKTAIEKMPNDEKPQPAVVLALENATKDLQMPSETDAPFEVVFFALENGETEMSPEKLAQLAGAPDDAEIETRELDEFFEAAAAEEDWMNAEEKASAKRFAALLQILKTDLKNVQVLVWGDAEKTVAILGTVEGGIAGVLTIVVET